MKITDIKSFSVWQHEKNLFIVKVETDEGIHGIGEGGVISRDLAMKGIVDHFRDIGRVHILVPRLRHLERRG